MCVIIGDNEAIFSGEYIPDLTLYIFCYSMLCILLLDLQMKIMTLHDVYFLILLS